MLFSKIRMHKLLLVFALLFAAPAFAAKPKAIILFYADDLGYGDTSVYEIGRASCRERV